MITSQFKWNGDQVKIAAYETMGLSVWELAILWHGNAVLLCPVDTGLLRDSLQIREGNMASGKKRGPDISKPPKNTAYGGTAVHYAPHVEYGTKRGMIAQPYIRPAFDLITGKAVTVVKNTASKSKIQEYFR